MFHIHLICKGKKNKIINVSDQTTIESIKKKNGNDDIELIYNGKILEDNCKLIEYSISNEANIHVIWLNTRTLIERKLDEQNYLVESFMSILTQLNQSNSINDEREIPNYENEIENLVSMGFTNRIENQSLLSIHNGNIETVINILLGQI